MSRIVRAAALVAVWLAGGVAIASWVLRLPIEMPDFLDFAIRRGLNGIGRDDLANPDDLENLAFAVILAASLIVSALVVFAANLALAFAVRRLRR